MIQKLWPSDLRGRRRSKNAWKNKRKNAKMWYSIKTPIKTKMRSLPLFLLPALPLLLLSALLFLLLPALPRLRLFLFPLPALALPLSCLSLLPLLDLALLLSCLFLLPLPALALPLPCLFFLPLPALALPLPCLSLFPLPALALPCFFFFLFLLPALALPLFFLILDLFSLLALLLLGVHFLQLSPIIVLFADNPPLEQGDVPPCQENMRMIWSVLLGFRRKDRKRKSTKQIKRDSSFNRWQRQGKKRLFD